MRLPSGKEWLQQPVTRGWIKYRELLETHLDIADIADMNDAIEVEEENRARAQQAANRRR